MKIFSTVIVCLLLVFAGFSIGMHTSYFLMKDEIGVTATHPVKTDPTDGDIANAIDRLTDAILAGTDTMAKESNETQAIWKEIQERHYSPY